MKMYDQQRGNLSSLSTNLLDHVARSYKKSTVVNVEPSSNEALFAVCIVGHERKSMSDGIGKGPFFAQP